MELISMNSAELDELFEAYDDMRRKSSGAITIGNLLKKLSTFDHSTEVTLTSRHELVKGFCSYRGYYEDLAINTTSDYTYRIGKINTVGDLIDTLKSALDEKVMYGYKGGEYPITTDTLVWVADHDDVSRNMIVDAIEFKGVALVITSEQKGW